MNGIVFRNILPQTIIATINKFLYKPKDQNFIINKLRKLSNYHDCSVKNCKMLIRDSANISVFMDHDRNFNFASFLENIVTYAHYYGQFGPYIEIICIQLIRNNPQLIWNGYHTGMGRSPALYLMLVYVCTQQLFGYSLKPSQQLAIALFNVLKYIVQNQLTQPARYLHFFIKYGLEIGAFFSCRTIELIDLTLQSLEKYIIKAHPSQIKIQELIDNSKLLENMFEFFSGNIRAYFYDFKYLLLQQFMDEGYPQLHKNLHKILYILNTKYPQLTKLLYKKYSKDIILIQNYKIFKELYKYQNLHEIFFDNRLLFKIFENRCMDIVKVIWANENMRGSLSKEKVNDKNLLETVALSYGLTHNIISILWQSKLFPQLPQIKNKKSKSIITQKYKKTISNKKQPQDIIIQSQT